jgi:hypothetical protein
MKPHEHSKFGVDSAHGTETGVANRLWREFTSNRREVFGLQRSNASHGIEGRFVSGKQQMVRNSIRSPHETETYPRNRTVICDSEAPTRAEYRKLDEWPVAKPNLFAS